MKYWTETRILGGEMILHALAAVLCLDFIVSGHAAFVFVYGSLSALGYVRLRRHLQRSRAPTSSMAPSFPAPQQPTQDVGSDLDSG